MEIPYVPGTGRQPHCWKLRSEGFRELLQKHRWHLRAAHSEKFIHGNRVMLTVLEQTPQHVYCCFQSREDYWASVSSSLREKRARSRRDLFRLVKVEFE